METNNLQNIYWMTSDQKKALMLLESVIFHYHELDESEKLLLKETANELDALEELEWAYEFIGQDRYSAFERTRQYLKEIFADIDKETKLQYLNKVWTATNRKGYITEMEATALLKLAKDWSIESELIKLIRKK